MLFRGFSVDVGILILESNTRILVFQHIIYSFSPESQSFEGFLRFLIACFPIVNFRPGSLLPSHRALKLLGAWCIRFEYALQYINFVANCRARVCSWFSARGAFSVVFSSTVTIGGSAVRIRLAPCVSACWGPFSFSPSVNGQNPILRVGNSFLLPRSFLGKVHFKATFFELGKPKKVETPLPGREVSR